MAVSEIASKQATEIAFWRDAEHESPDSDSVPNIVNKASDALVLLDCFHRYRDELPGDGASVLELGGGQGWASCIFKRLHPGATVTATDISPYAVAGLPQWERIFNTRLDRSYACLSYEIEEPDASLDLVFCFAAAHHFLAHKRTLREIRRVLKPGGKAIYFYEPVTPSYLYKRAYRRVNRNRPDVPEDVLKPAVLRALSADAGLDFVVDYYPSLLKRSPMALMYFFVLGRVPVLRRLLPCTANLVFIRQKNFATA